WTIENILAEVRDWEVSELGGDFEAGRASHRCVGFRRWIGTLGSLVLVLRLSWVGWRLGRIRWRVVSPHLRYVLRKVFAPVSAILFCAFGHSMDEVIHEDGGFADYNFCRGGVE